MQSNNLQPVKAHPFIMAFVALLACVALAACGPSPEQIAQLTQAAYTPTPSHTPTATASSTPTATPTPPPSATPTATVEVAEKGFDLAAVSVTNPQPDVARVRFYYKLNEGESRAFITLNVPRACRDGDYIFPFEYPFVSVTLPQGWAEIDFKHVLQGECISPQVSIDIWRARHQGGSVYIEGIVYQESFDIELRATRLFPTLNSDELITRNFTFTPLDDWKGQISFEYALDEDIPLETEEYYIAMRGTTNACSFQAYGETITAHTGTYVIDVDLLEDLWSSSPGEDAACLDGFNRYTFQDYFFYAIDAYTHNAAIFRSMQFETVFRAEVSE